MPPPLESFTESPVGALTARDGRSRPCEAPAARGDAAAAASADPAEYRNASRRVTCGDGSHRSCALSSPGSQSELSPASLPRICRLCDRTAVERRPGWGSAGPAINAAAGERPAIIATTSWRAAIAFIWRLRGGQGLGSALESSEALAVQKLTQSEVHTSIHSCTDTASGQDGFLRRRSLRLRQKCSAGWQGGPVSAMAMIAGGRSCPAFLTTRCSTK